MKKTKTLTFVAIPLVRSFDEVVTKLALEKRASFGTAHKVAFHLEPLLDDELSSPVSTESLRSPVGKFLSDELELTRVMKVGLLSKKTVQRSYIAEDCNGECLLITQLWHFKHWDFGSVRDSFWKTQDWSKVTFVPSADKAD